MNRASANTWVLLIAFLVLFSTFGRSEGISGLVKDEQGGIIPGVSVTIKNLETGLTRSLLTGDSGRYDATNLPLGVYEVTASLPGFKTAVRRGVTLTVGQDLVLDLTLAVGELSEERSWSPEKLRWWTPAPPRSQAWWTPERSGTFP